MSTKTISEWHEGLGRWRDWLTQWRIDQRQALNYDDKYYLDEAFSWIPSNLISTKIMA